jgi:hypothetical protein
MRALRSFTHDSNIPVAQAIRQGTVPHRTAVAARPADEVIE